MVLGQLIVNGLIAGSIYALISSGYSLIYATNRFMHFAHGIVVIASSYVLFLLFSLLNIPFVLSLLLTVIGGTGLGYAMNRLIYTPLQKKGASNVILLIVSVGMAIVVENLLLLAFGAKMKALEFITLHGGLQFWGISITPLQIIIILTSIIILIGLYVLMKLTRLGKRLRAVADHPELASISGIPQQWIQDLSFLLGSGLGAMAGILIALEQNIVATAGTQLMIKGFTGAIIGGITSVPGAIIGSYVLGLVENIGIWFLPASYKSAITFILLVGFLVFRPTGLFGINKGVKQ